ncbi:hypothetical protein [Paraburkholderia sp. BL10I2N1]|uniref:hypothetical protein n=1 Tax=Paraburkholderia sp. BL10I2N1 TaxID=1938796 RepID=UPI0010EF3839|nr:hypothetical protein [Paraburkholderia sp. BL10I2N1]TDN62236.1 hypothetical protein B0G77_5779 [Paraburkholderia sp. BL10I2N1]
MIEHLANLRDLVSALMRRAWPQVLTMIVFMVAISLRFPLWFVMLSAAVNGAALTYLARCFASQPSRRVHDPLLGAVLVGSGLASVALTLKWWTVEKQLQLAPGVLLHLAGHSTSNSTQAWSSVLTQWGSCSIFLVIVAVWVRGSRRAD